MKAFCDTVTELALNGHRTTTAGVSSLTVVLDDGQVFVGAGQNDIKLNRYSRQTETKREMEHTNTTECHRPQEITAGSNAHLLSPQQGPRVCFITARHPGVRQPFYFDSGNRCGSFENSSLPLFFVRVDRR